MDESDPSVLVLLLFVRTKRQSIGLYISLWTFASFSVRTHLQGSQSQANVCSVT